MSAESSVSAQEPEELSEAEPELPQDDEEITGAVEQIEDGTEEPQPEQNVTQPEGNQQAEQSQTVERLSLIHICAGLVYTLAADTMSVQSMMAGAGLGGMVS